MELLSSCYIFKGLSSSQFQRLSTITKKEQVSKGEFLIQEGQNAEALFVLEEGDVELLTTVNDHFELPVAILRKPGDCIGTSSLVAPYIYNLSARCLSETRLLIIQQTVLEKLMQEDHKLGCVIMKNLAQHLLKQLKESRQELKIHFNTIFKSTHP